MSKPYSYLLRPGYRTSELLIEFVIIKEPKSFIQELINLLTVNDFLYNGSTDVWMNQEILIHLESSNGKVNVIRDFYDFVFILGENNQKDILRIDTILIKSGLFEKKKADYSKYKR